MAPSTVSVSMGMTLSLPPTLYFWHPCSDHIHLWTWPSFWSQLHTCEVTWLHLAQLSVYYITKSVPRLTDSIQKYLCGSSCYSECLQDHILPWWHEHTLTHKFKTIPATASCGWWWNRTWSLICYLLVTHVGHPQLLRTRTRACTQTETHLAALEKPWQR